MKYLFIILLFVTQHIFAQKSFLDSLNSGKSIEDSVMYAKLKQKLSKSKVGKQVYGTLFRDVYNTNSNKNEISQIEINPFDKYDGKVIGKIFIRKLEIFGPSVNDTTRKGNRIEHFASKSFHYNTRETVIRKSFLLFKEGDKINPQTLKDNERLLRANPIIHDARILILERKDVSWVVDVLVITQDVWSINFDISGSSLNDFAFGVEDRNFQGRGHSLLNKITWRGNDPYQRFGWRSIYTVPYFGNSFITGQIKLINERDLTQYSAHIFRPFLTVETHNAGSLELGYAKVLEYKKLFINGIDSSLVFPVSYFYSDAWLGHAFRLDASNRNKQLVVAIRRSNYEYRKRPEVRSDFNKIYWNRTTWLASVGFSNRNYQRDFLIYGYGRTEDVPVGNLFAFTLGTENTEFGNRNYAGIQFAKGKYLPSDKGYFYLLANAGTYLKQKATQQGVIGVQSFYFSRLMKIAKSQTRQFINIGLTYGINRDELDYLNISGKDGILGVNSEGLRGDKRLTFGYESVLFSHKSIVGFRVAYFGFVNLGLVSLKDKLLIESKLYQGYGVGLRLRNENLTFNTFQIRLGYYPNIPNISSAFRFAFDGSQPLKLRDFDISAPTILPLR
ncbi:hypothetical protein EMA8858_01551 [Emticicia aquatica]|uniref:Outer membrane protein assembly factor BamA n=1 Tax=Emticicia aquatica TaxID=1681835 RepID=A0ABN8ERA8_9BACT|nr:hypothetical protein [Emticicia aquatica]CAH0995429.1 hypothetical protein EMA8858_01551 [Emticicia aquatica]